MRSAGRSEFKKVIAGAVALTLAAVFVFSLAFTVFEADHDCEGEHCHICATIDVCGSLLRQAGNANAVKAAMAVVVLFVVVALIPVASDIPAATPVSDKVMLND